MATRKAIRGVLGNFLGTYTSRNSDFDGYWLFGFVVAGLQELRIDLFAPPIGEPDAPLSVALRSAGVKFADQVHKAGVVRLQIMEAWLTIRKQSGPVLGSINGVSRAGHNVSFSAGAVMEGGRRYERQQVLFVAPHSAEVELRSARAAEPGSGADGGA